MKLSDAIYKRLVLLNFVLLFCFLLAGVLIVGALKNEFYTYVVDRYKKIGKLELYRSKLTAKALLNKEGHEPPPHYEIKMNEGDLRDIQLTVERMLKKATYRDGVTNWAVMGDEDKKWYPVTFRAEGEDYHAKIRIRGDLENHWAYSKKSWRIKFAKEKLFHGRRELNIVLPGDKGFTMERIAQEMGRELGLLVPDSGYAQVQLNGVEMGLYFWFENNSPEMLEKLGYAGGEIFRENNTWIQTNYTGFGIPERFINVHPGNFTSSINQDQELGRYAARWNRFLQLVRGEANENFEEEIATLLDLEKYAKWNALTWLFGSLHSQWSDNLRWFYNPTTGLFEPLLYDVQTDELNNQKSGTFEVQSDDPLARRLMRIPKYHEMRNKVLWRLVNDPQFDFEPRSEKLFDRIRPYLFMGVGADLEADKIDKRDSDQKRLCRANRQRLKDNLAFGRIFISPTVSRAGNGSALELRIIPDSLAGIQVKQLKLAFGAPLAAPGPEMRLRIAGEAGPGSPEQSRELTAPQVAISRSGDSALQIDFKDIALHTPRDETLLPRVGTITVTLEFPAIPAEKWATRGFLTGMEWALANSITEAPFAPQHIFQAPLAYAWSFAEPGAFFRSGAESEARLAGVGVEPGGRQRDFKADDQIAPPSESIARPPGL